MFDDPRLLERLQIEIDLRRSALAEHQAQVVRLQKEIDIFAADYDRVLGKLEAQLDAVRQQIEALQAPPVKSTDRTETYASFEESFDAKYRQPQNEPIQPTRRTVSEPTLRALYRKLARLYHPDTTSDPAEKARRTVIMARINAAYRAKNADELYAIDKSPNGTPKAAASSTWSAPRVPTYGDLLKVSRTLDDQITDAKIAYQALMNSPLMMLKIECSVARSRRRDLLQEMAAKLRADLTAAQDELRALQRTR